MEPNCALGAPGPGGSDIDMTGRSVLVTGATGFLGRHLVPRLVRAGARVHATTRTVPPAPTDPVRWVPLDLSNGTALATVVHALRPDLVVHLGGRVSSAVDPGLVQPTFGTLLASSIALLSAAQTGTIGRLVLVGSTDEPGPGATPASPYGAAKGAMTAYAKLYAEAFAAPVVCVRPAEAYGPGQAPTKLLPYVAATALRGERPRLSSGTRRGDWIYVDDVIDGLLVAAREAAPGADLDLGTGVLHRSREVVEGLLRALELDVQPVWGALPDRPHETERVADVHTTTRAIGWRSRTSLVEGLARTAEAAKRAAHPAVSLRRAV